VSSRIKQLAAIAIFGVLLSVVLIIFGLPENTATTKLMLELSALPLSVSLAAGNLILLERAKRTPSHRAKVTLLSGAALSGVGLIVMLVALFVSRPGLVQFGQFVVFVGMLAVLFVAMRLQERGNAAWLDLDSLGDPDDDPPTSLIDESAPAEATIEATTDASN
jgi:peptidoglycan/LPS O-acetylase OafA/YrhL